MKASIAIMPKPNLPHSEVLIMSGIRATMSVSRLIISSGRAQRFTR
jgi:hypothetical protein